MKRLKKEDEYLADQFKSFGGYYVATIGYDQYMRNISYRQAQKKTSSNAYNGAWGD